jgi:hypothetical protein
MIGKLGKDNIWRGIKEMVSGEWAGTLDSRNHGCWRLAVVAIAGVGAGEGSSGDIGVSQYRPRKCLLKHNFRIGDD